MRDDDHLANVALCVYWLLVVIAVAVAWKVAGAPI